ncbi:Protein serine-threonine phosphatase [Hyella patelloides LEGE 07179]|uniref:Protein serine-threonine phosphatase n=1 Tax=Hyella patelloides LEGE 07179 TaxID=945734 RepID=A0A563VJG0_9CYAN|nr:polynucleotide kinase-phosphatase [Hyella patelloides]VEP11549.1 Protein serine-threonine phosphatase [Hyella patelloides LEGE 07179]
MKITSPELSLIVLIGASGAGKSTFARQHFKPTEILSSDYFRGLVSDDENDQAATKDAFEVLHYILAKRLAAGKLTVIDATNVQSESRKPLLQLAKQYHCFATAIVFNLPEAVCHERNKQRPNRQFGSHVVRNHIRSLRRSLRNLKREGFRFIYKLSSVEDIEAVEVIRQPMWTNRKQEHGPFDIIGDIHGCCDELEQLLKQLGYVATENNSNSDSWWYFPTYSHPEGRKALFLGDLVDRGDRILDTLKLVHNMLAAGSALCICGNHENKLIRKLNGKNVKINHGLEQTMAEIEAINVEKRDPVTSEIQTFLKSLISHYVLDEGKLVVAHAGLREELQGRGSGYVRSFALYGETTGEIDEFGFPVRYEWAREYRGKAMVVYGHTPVKEAEWLNNTIDIDTGCVFGGKLTALRYPEQELVSVDAAKVYCEPIKPLDAETNTLGIQQQQDDVLDIADVLGKRLISTKIYRQIAIREDQSITALEIMSRFAVNPKWLIYLPPTMSPVATSQLPHFLEHPAEAFAYYQQQNIDRVICEEKHMGSRCVIVLCRDESVAERSFGIKDEGIGVCYTRTGRKFFNDDTLETELLNRLNRALTESNFWEHLNTDWVCLDCELMPWSAKAQALLKEQYAPVGVAAKQGLNATVACLEQTAHRGIDVTALLDRYQQRAELPAKYIKAYQQYCWSVTNINDLKLAPFHILATEGQTNTDKPHNWHMEKIAQFCQNDNQLLLATKYKIVNLNNQTERDAATNWWLEMTQAGGEGMVVKPMNFISYNGNKLIQPAVKCRGAEYLRIIYGLEYSLPEHLERLKQRGLGKKRSLALREFALGIESLERFVNRAPLRQVHECVFGVLALESEPVDPRL